ncbi:MAG TPA: ATP-binding protein [Candidatus Binataceae bacterium]|nr:ATP-binding protein [Candidatus Binataceae bacterium]
MGLRAKLPTTFLALLTAAILAVSALYLNRMLRLLAHGLVTSADRCSKEVFEQVRVALSNAGTADPATVLRDDKALKAAIRSSLAFSEYVVYLRVVSIDGRDLVSSNTEPESETKSDRMVLPISDLEELSSSQWPLGLARALWSDHLYESSRSIDVNSKPFGFIKVGISTGLIANQVHQTAENMGLIALLALIITTAAAYTLSNIILRPVLAVTTSMEQLAAGNAEVNLNVAGSDEFSNLADKFNVLSRRIRAERSRWESERGGIFDALRSIQDLVMLIDSDGTLLFANTEAQGVLGLPAGGVSEGKPLRMLLGADHPMMQLIGPALAAGTEVRDVAFEIGDRFDRRRFLVSALSLGQGRESAGLLVIMRDLEQVRELETVVDQSSRLARLGSLLSGVAHQIRTPLNVMTLQLELLRQDVEGGRDPASRISRVSQEISRLAKAIDALMRFMRPEQLKCEDLAVNDLLREIASQITRPDIRVEYQLDNTIPIIKADRDLLSEALRNMINNGVEAMPQGGVMTLSTAHCDGEGGVEIDIRDCGAGISKENLERIFNLYFTTKEGGSGLGLSLALRAIDLHGGSVNVESKPGVGTTFKIQLPRVNDVPPAAAQLS